jgi:hypothetical protein
MHGPEAINLVRWRNDASPNIRRAGTTGQSPMSACKPI